MAWRVPAYHWLPLASKQHGDVVSSRLSSPSHPLSTPALWARVCFCSCLQSAWLTVIILTKRGERSRLQIASKQSALSLSALTAQTLHLCRHLCPVSIFSLSSSISVFTRGGGAVSCATGRFGSLSEVKAVSPALKSRLWPAVGRGT